MSTIAAAEGHPCLRELRVSDGQEEAWLRAAPRLPALSTLKLVVHPQLFKQEGLDGEAAQMLRVFGWVAHCEWLSHLVLKVAPHTHVAAQDLLAAVGAAAGGLLKSLTLRGAQLPPTRESATRAMQTLVGCPHLEVLWLWTPGYMEASAAEARARELLLVAPALAPRCPALREVRVDESAVRLQRHPDGRVPAAEFIGSCFDG